jgi:hypothetical protein
MVPRQIRASLRFRAAILVVAGCLALVTLVADKPKLSSMWKSVDVASVSFAGKKVAGMVISQDEALRVPGEEALVRELTALGLPSVATYRIAPKEELRNPDTAKGWFERANVEGVVALRVLTAQTTTVHNPSMWVSQSYSTLWSYYGYGWGTSATFVPASTDQNTHVVVETTIYSVPRNELLWAAVAETTNPKNMRQYMNDLVTEVVKALQKQGLAKQVKK